MQDNVIMAISTGNLNEPMKIKLPGDTDYIELYDNDTYQFDVGEQKSMVDALGLAGMQDQVFINTEKDEKENINPIDQAQGHVINLNSPVRYSGMNATAFNKDFLAYSLTHGGQDITGFDYVLMHHNEEAQRDLQERYPEVYGLE